MSNSSSTSASRRADSASGAVNVAVSQSSSLSFLPRLLLRCGLPFSGLGDGEREEEGERDPDTEDADGVGDGG